MINRDVKSSYPPHVRDGLTAAGRRHPQSRSTETTLADECQGGCLRTLRFAVEALSEDTAATLTCGPL